MIDDSLVRVEGELLPGAGGPTIALLHSLALDRTVWNRGLARLRELADVVVCDLPGHGRSERIVRTTIEEMADAVAAALARLVGGPAVVWGMSLGGCVAQALAVRHPDQVLGLGLADTTAWYGPNAERAWQDRADRARCDGLASLADFQLARWFSPAFLAEHRDLADELLAVFQRNDLASYTATCRAMGAMDLRELIAAIDVPTRIIVGSDDYATPVAHAEDLHSRIASSTLRVLDGKSHLSAVEAPEVFAAETVRLLAQLR
jgi:3-oxoadipate enol-lactonase